MFRKPDPRTLTTEQRHEIRSGYGRAVFAMNYGPCAVYVFERGGKLSAYGFRGKATNAEFQYSFSSMAALGAYSDEWAAGVAASETAKAARRAERSAFRHPLAVGDVLKSSWGYEQTNVDWYEVVGLVGSTMVEVRQIAAQRREDGHMSGTCAPLPGHYVGGIVRCRVSAGNSVQVGRNHASPAKFVTVGGVRVFTPAYWSSYA